MSFRRPPPIRLDALRRSTWLAIFVLSLFVLRIGVVAACAPSDIVETLAAAAHGDLATHAAGDAESDPDPTHATGHCLHCSCHQAVAIPLSLVAPVTSVPGFVAARPSPPRANAPPDLSLRPPIV